ncbi:MAG: NRDE family protein [Leptospiraceae bacterium]|nr:NRDE family protein [Leptospiraceae bacterium]
MCTSIIHRNSSGEFGIGFNRDESVKRKSSLVPSVFSSKNGYYLCPVDGDFGGTWIGVTSKRKIFAILNYYEATLKLVRNAKSRGLIVKDLLSGELSEEELSTTDLSLYYPFRIISLDQDSAILYVWNGEILALEERNLEWEVIASSFMLGAEGEVYRKKVFEEQFYPKAKSKKFVDLASEFLSSHEPEKGAKSPCMHRRDAHTQSQTIITIEKNIARMSYKQGQPCETKDFEQYELELS